MDHFDRYNVMLAISPNIPVLQGHIFNSFCEIEKKY